MLTSLAEMEHVPRGAITVGANEGTCLHILPEVFADFKKQYPDVSVNIKRADYARILESVTDNSVDFGVVSLPVKDNRLTVVLIHQDELVIIAPPHHPLGKMKSASVGDLAKYPLVLPKAGHTRDALDELFRERRLKPNYSMELDSSELLKRFVAAGVGVGFIARSNVQEDVRAGVLVAIPMADAQLRRDLALVFRKDKALSRAALAFIEIAKKLKSSAAWTSKIEVDEDTPSPAFCARCSCSLPFSIVLARTSPPRLRLSPARQTRPTLAYLQADRGQGDRQQALHLGGSRRRQRTARRHHRPRRRFQEGSAPTRREWSLQQHRLTPTPTHPPAPSSSSRSPMPTNLFLPASPTSSGSPTKICLHESPRTHSALQRRTTHHRTFARSGLGCSSGPAGRERHPRPRRLPAQQQQDRAA